ncbi:MAG TPA: transcriptional regulator [Methanomassiliicoccales archaeon]|jgi:predicted transcriptional regulator|nr:transcriptional regulator [Euryarchaeota archaeon]HOE52508.1 transcriptional regulator [Methanomassiliicoccales archaeon]HQM66881.1 transcriptional regulator [Methanomassiliicoccales archaeon]HRR66430.1 transcriptional regulator [Methanomassiliicoccales archaeon]
MSMVDELVSGILRSEEGFREALRHILTEDLRLSVPEFCERTGLSPSTIYKILQEQREPNLRTVRAVIKGVRKLDANPGGEFIAVIASRPVLSRIEERLMKVGERTVRVKEYPACTMEDAIIAAVKAERDGALALVCAPIVAPTIEQIVRVPVSVIVPKDSMVRAIEVAAAKVL